jgi:hypothetical protein
VLVEAEAEDTVEAEQIQKAVEAVAVELGWKSFTTQTLCPPVFMSSLEPRAPQAPQGVLEVEVLEERVAIARLRPIIPIRQQRGFFAEQVVAEAARVVLSMKMLSVEVVAELSEQEPRELEQALSQEDCPQLPTLKTETVLRAAVAQMALLLRDAQFGVEGAVAEFVTTSILQRGAAAEPAFTEAAEVAPEVPTLIGMD